MPANTTVFPKGGLGVRHVRALHAVLFASCGCWLGGKTVANVSLDRDDAVAVKTPIEIREVRGTLDKQILLFVHCFRFFLVH